jgi:hypothetical protein
MAITVSLPAREGEGIQDIEDAEAAALAAINAATLRAYPTDVTFSGSTVTSERSDDQTVTTVFEAAGTVLTTYGAPISKVIRTTFNTDGSISEVYV